MTFELLLFSVDIPLIEKAIAAGVNCIVVDWESKGKQQRQAGRDTAISNHTTEDLRLVRKATRAPVICRLNRYSLETKEEVEKAIALGADELLLPMVSSPQEVEKFFVLVQERVKVGILIETKAALQCLRELAQFPLARVFVGLNDLMIENQARHIFTPLIDGTLADIRSHFRTLFGFGGLTVPDGGFPVPCSLLLQEMLRLECHFTFLRRSFIKDIQGRNMAVEIPRIREWIQTVRQRSQETIEEDQRILRSKIHEL